jgi:hypothetical protein
LDTTTVTQTQNWLHVWQPFNLLSVKLAQELSLHGVNTLTTYYYFTPTSEVAFQPISTQSHRTARPLLYGRPQLFCNPPSDSAPYGLSLACLPHPFCRYQHYPDKIFLHHPDRGRGASSPSFPFFLMVDLLCDKLTAAVKPPVISLAPDHYVPIPGLWAWRFVLYPMGTL